MRDKVKCDLSSKDEEVKLQKKIRQGGWLVGIRKDGIDSTSSDDR